MSASWRGLNTVPQAGAPLSPASSTAQAATRGSFPDSTRGNAIPSQAFQNNAQLIAPADEGVGFASFDMTNQTFLNPSLTAQKSEENSTSRESMYQRYLDRRTKERAAAAAANKTGLTSADQTAAPYGKSDALGQGLGNGLDKPLDNGLSKDSLMQGLGQHPY